MASEREKEPVFRTDWDDKYDIEVQLVEPSEIDRAFSDVPLRRRGIIRIVDKEQADPQPK